MSNYVFRIEIIYKFCINFDYIWLFNNLKGMSFTNTSPLVVPTRAKKVIFSVWKIWVKGIFIEKDFLLLIFLVKHYVFILVLSGPAMGLQYILLEEQCGL